MPYYQTFWVLYEPFPQVRISTDFGHIPSLLFVLIPHLTRKLLCSVILPAVPKLLFCSQDRGEISEETWTGSFPGTCLLIVNQLFEWTLQLIGLIWYSLKRCLCFTQRRQITNWTQVVLVCFLIHHLLDMYAHCKWTKGSQTTFFIYYSLSWSVISLSLWLWIQTSDKTLYTSFFVISLQSREAEHYLFRFDELYHFNFPASETEGSEINANAFPHTRGSEAAGRYRHSWA